MQRLIIDPEFQALIPPLKDEEFQQLEQNILADGCRDPLVIWHGTILDGHNRYKICTDNNLDFETAEANVETRDEALKWMIDNQLGRRNITDEQRTYLLGLRYRQEKKTVGAPEGNKNRNIQLGHNAPIVPTAEAIAIQHGINASTVQRAEKYADGVDNIAKALPELKQDILQGKTDYAKKDIQSFAKIDVDAEVKKRLTELEEEKRQKREAKKAEVRAAQAYIQEQTDVETKLAPILYVGDSTHAGLDEEYDLLLTDPPYSTDVDNIEEFVGGWLYDALWGVKDTGFAYIFIGAYPEELKAYLNERSPDHIKLEQVLIWTYKNTLGNNPKNKYKQNYQCCLFYRGINAPALDAPLTSEQWAVQEINAPDGRLGDRFHAWQKPLELAERFIRHSTKQGDLIYDPFACTGTFLVAGAKLGRRAIGYEIDRENAEIAIGRGCVYG